MREVSEVLTVSPKFGVRGPEIQILGPPSARQRHASLQTTSNLYLQNEGSLLLYSGRLTKSKARLAVNAGQVFGFSCPVEIPPVYVGKPK